MATGRLRRPASCSAGDLRAVCERRLPHPVSPPSPATIDLAQGEAMAVRGGADDSPPCSATGKELAVAIGADERYRGQQGVQETEMRQYKFMFDACVILGPTEGR